MLRFVAGLTTAEIARLFLVSEPTMAARLTRAKAKMAVAGIPLPDRPLNQSPSGFGYMGGSQGPQIAFNATYLRQDFSVMQKVEKPSPWPEWQRFDFVVRERVLSHEEAAQFRAELGAETADGLTRHQKAALTALRGLTGADAEPTAAAWRRVLDLPPR